MKPSLPCAKRVARPTRATSCAKRGCAKCSVRQKKITNASPSSAARGTSRRWSPKSLPRTTTPCSKAWRKSKSIAPGYRGRTAASASTAATAQALPPPAWYAHLWVHPDDGVRWIGRAAALLRGKGHDISAAHVIETVRLANASAALPRAEPAAPCRPSRSTHRHRRHGR